jgi:hypothetical protein
MQIVAGMALVLLALNPDANLLVAFALLGRQ